MTLRWLCPCAFCRGEMGMPGWLDSAPTLTDAQTTLTGITIPGGSARRICTVDGPFMSR